MIPAGDPGARDLGGRRPPEEEDSSAPEWERDLEHLRAEVRRMRQALRDVGEHPARGWASEEEEPEE